MRTKHSPSIMDDSLMGVSIPSSSSVTSAVGMRMLSARIVHPICSLVFLLVRRSSPPACPATCLLMIIASFPPSLCVPIAQGARCNAYHPVHTPCLQSFSSEFDSSDSVGDMYVYQSRRDSLRQSPLISQCQMDGRYRLIFASH